MSVGMSVVIKHSQNLAVKTSVSHKTSRDGLRLNGSWRDQSSFGAIRPPPSSSTSLPSYSKEVQQQCNGLVHTLPKAWNQKLVPVYQENMQELNETVSADYDYDDSL